MFVLFLQEFKYDITVLIELKRKYGKSKGVEI